MRFRLKEEEVVIAAATGVTAWALLKKGVAGSIPALGPIAPPFVLIIIGVVLAAMIDGKGTTGGVVEGVGYGFIAAGALGL